MAAKKPSKADCRGCRDELYNERDFGMNRTPSGAFECWSLKAAVLVSARDVPLSALPPHDRIAPTTRPNCYRAPGFVRMPVKP